MAETFDFGGEIVWTPTAEYIEKAHLTAFMRQHNIPDFETLMKRSTEQGMVSFDQELFNLYQEGEITLDDALLHADSANEVRLMIKLGSGDLDKFSSKMEDISLIGGDELDPGQGC